MYLKKIKHVTVGRFVKGLALVYLLTNYSPINFLLKENYTYSNIDGSFIISEECGKGFNYEYVIRRYAVYLYQNPEKNKNDNRLYRVFTIKPWLIWEWHDLIFRNDRFWLPFLYKEKCE
ncbi:hypothetical protein BC343_00225 [Mucilaginibacter pedocola]|uniref:Uncharacterized protein n=1 Tax=Mucilaginibacter pedocola TaxID=1792845 RepID=A0A1S9PKP8_9SPHI|nr:hypothetical protein BC343_00225 [Mucilaginibacter pedocola]